jgi:hypothetical protein
MTTLSSLAVCLPPPAARATFGRALAVPGPAFMVSVGCFYDDGQLYYDDGGSRRLVLSDPGASFHARVEPRPR